MLFAVLGVVAVFYYAVIYSAIMRFPPAVLTDPSHDVYTLVFADYPNRVVSIFLQAFPVFVLSANFPIISITLRNNLIMLGNKFADSAKDPGGGAQHSTGAGGVWAGLGRRGGAACGGAWVRHADVLYPTLAIGPPIVVAYFTEDVEVLISYTGSYAGVGIQYIIPACACYFGRQAPAPSFSPVFLARLSPFTKKCRVRLLCGDGVAEVCGGRECARAQGGQEGSGGERGGEGTRRCFPFAACGRHARPPGLTDGLRLLNTNVCAFAGSSPGRSWATPPSPRTRTGRSLPAMFGWA